MTHDAPAPRVLVCGGPAFDADGVGGIQHVMADLVAGLRDRGWQVDTIFGARRDAGPALHGFRPKRWQLRLGSASAALRLPAAWRLPAGVVVHGSARLRALSSMLFKVDEALRQGGYAAVIACIDVRSPVGLAELAASARTPAILVSLDQVTRELRHRSTFATARRVARIVGRRGVHPRLYSPMRSTPDAAVVFASEAWRDAAVAAGVRPAAAAVIPFGVPVPAELPPPRPVANPARLLWTARLSAGKGLDRFLPAVAALRRERSVRLTIVAAPEPGPYGPRVARLIRQLRLDDVIEWRTPVPRPELAPLFRAHDVLLFDSVFREPVAQILLLAFAHGLPVVGPASPDPRSLLQDGATAFCFADRSARAVAAAIERALADDEIRRATRERAFARVAAVHSLDRTIACYDALVRRISGTAPRAPSP